MGIFKKFSLGVFIGRFGKSFKRFPLAMLLTLFLACFLFYINHGGNVGMKKEFFLIFYPITGALLAVALSLLTEDFKSRFLAVALQAVVHVAWFAVSYYLAQFEHFSIPQMIAVSATVATIGLSIFLICFYRRNHDLPFWNFSMRTILALIIAFAIGCILYLGLLLLVESFKMLFDLHIAGTVCPDIAIFCLVMLAPALFMNIIPEREQKYLYDVPVFSRFAKGVVQYLFIPLLLLYMVTLYIYATKILLAWQLPVGWVSYLVTASMLGMVVLLYITFPIQYEQGNSIFKKVTRCLPLAMLPLLVLMTVAIGRRLSDYGITISRLYLLVFNVWCYVVCIGLLITRNKRIWWIPASFAVVLFLISVGPQSIANITQRQLLGEARKAFADTGIKQLPLTGDQYDLWLKNVDSNVAASIDAKLDYLRMDFGYNSISGLLAKDVITGTYTKMDRDGMTVSTSNGPSNFDNDDLVNNIEIPRGYSRMTLVHFHNDQVLEDGDKVLIKIAPSVSPEGLEDDVPVVSPPNEVEYEFAVSYKRFIESSQDRNPNGAVKPIVIDNGQALLMVDRFSFSLHQDKSYYLAGDGLLFTK